MSKKLICAGAALAAGWLAVGEVLFRFGLDTHAKHISMRNLLGEDKPNPDADWFRAHAKPLRLKSRDGLTLRGYLLPVGSEPSTHRYAIVCHGYCAAPEGMAPYAKKFLERGYTVLCPALRAHGGSDGRYIGMGWGDRLDILDWAAWLAGHDPQAEIVLFGISMGAATVMMAAGEPLRPEIRCVIADSGFTCAWDEFESQIHRVGPLRPEIRCVIADSGFTCAWDEFESQMRRVSPLPAAPLLTAADAAARPRTGWGFRQASAVAQLKKARVPMLFLHGEADEFVPYAMLEQVYAACASPMKEKHSFPGAAHCEAAFLYPEEYWAIIDAFLQRVAEAPEVAEIA